MEEKKKSNIWRAILIIIAIIIVILAIYTIRNYTIVKSLQGKIGQYKNSNNYHISYVETKNSNEKTLIDFYKKGNNQVYNRTENDSKISIYKKNNKVNTFLDTKGEKVAKINDNNNISLNIYNRLESDSTLEILISCITAKIKKLNYSGKECYEINGMKGLKKEEKLYIEKETGLLLKETSNDTTIEKIYEFDNVNDEVFNEPNLNEYKIQ